MAYISFDHAPAARSTPRFNAPRLAWGRLSVIAASLAIWVGVAFAIRALF